MPVDVLIQGQATHHPKSPALSETITRHLATIFHALELLDPEISLLLTDDQEIQALNQTWRGEDKPTDVLSFPIYEAEELPEDPFALGDIVISVPYAERMVSSREHRQRVAEELGVDAESLTWRLEEEVAFLFVHGLLHLIGYDHGDPEEEAEMKDMERKLWTIMTETSDPDA